MKLFRFLIDQDVYNITVHLLREWRYDVVTERELNLHRASNEVLL